MSRTRAVLTASVLLSTLALGGCSDDDPQPKFAPPSSEAPTSPSTTAATAPALGPEETVRAWVDAQNEALLTGDTSEMEDLAGPGCRGCADFSRPIRQVIAAGGKYIGGTWRVDAAEARTASGDDVTVDVAMSMAAGQTVPEGGADPIPFQADRRIMVFELAPDESVLKLTFVGFVE